MLLLLYDKKNSAACIKISNTILFVHDIMRLKRFVYFEFRQQFLDRATKILVISRCGMYDVTTSLE